MKTFATNLKIRGKVLTIFQFEMQVSNMSNAILFFQSQQCYD